MKKRIYLILLTLLLVFGCVFNVYAGYSSSGGSIDISADEFSFSNCLSVYEEWQTDFNVNNYNCIYRCGSFSGREIAAYIHLVSKNDVLVRSSEPDTSGLYYYTPYYYDSTTKTIKPGYIAYYAFIEPGHIGCYSTSIKNVYLTAEGDIDNYCNAPYCVNEEYALKYFQTMDASYLENASDFLDKPPAPHDVALYKASNEKSIYLYWENSEGFNDGVDIVEDGSKQTYIEYNYYYSNTAGESVLIDDTCSEYFPYSKRYQYKIDISKILEYDTGFIIGSLYNYWNYENLTLISNEVRFMYNMKSEILTLTYVDDNGSVIDTTVYDVTDYFEKNNSFTGGIIPLRDISAPSDGDYDFLSGIANVFGLLGNNGVMAIISDTMAFIPAPIVVIVTGFVSVAVLIALFKLFVH